MSLEKVKKIKKEIQGASHIDDTCREKLLGIVGDLEKELSSLDASHKTSADKLAEKAHESTMQAIKDSGSRQDELDQEIEGLKNAVDEFEVTHPKLVQLVNRFCMMLSDIGI
ncbi:DUF4404 family protein [Lentisphaerota bacterium ZTH]|nr:DUF4404 family protein [Lentisphaerota bacterium]WET06451.1 DUF4404 family protein [Lentisphaerota bacterium ZTH]